MAENKLKIFKSACRMCHGGCGALVYVKNNKVVKITGDPDSPLNQGKMCAKGYASIEHLYNPARLKYPLKRTAKRGQGKWKQISWDEAFQEIIEKITAIKDKYGAESIVIGQGTGRHHFFHVIRFANALGTPNWIEPGAAQCFVPRLLTGFMTFGGFPVCDYYGETSPKCLLVWGHNPVISGPDGEIQFKVRECLEKNPQLIVVDPRKTELAKKADLWLQIRPGTDSALALSMLHIIINEGLYDKEFVEKWTVGFPELVERVQKYNPGWAETITWIPAQKIKEAARMFAAVKPGALEWGAALEHTPNSLQTARAVGLLPALTGNIDVPGGWLVGEPVIPEVTALSPDLPLAMKEKRLGAGKYRVLSSRYSFWPSAHVPTVLQAMQTGEPYPAAAFLNFGNNGLVSYANSKTFYRALMGLEFVMVMDIYMTPTAELADIVLPAATWLEVDELLAAPTGSPHVVLAQQQIVRTAESRSDEEVLLELAKRLNLETPGQSVEEILNRQLETAGIRFKEFSGVTFDILKQKGAISVPIKYKRFAEEGFRTNSGKVELKSSYMENLGYDPLPYYQEPPESPVSQPGLALEYPLILITGGRSPYYFHSEYREIASLRQKEPDPLVEIHPETARKMGIKEGKWVWIETPRGKIKQRALLTEGIHPNVVNVRDGWWFPEKPAPEYGVWESNANVLTNNAPPYDPAVGTYQLRALLCKIYPVTARKKARMTEKTGAVPVKDDNETNCEEFDL
ncbi:MAG: molybdopterin-dependent oxidoreductase [Acidobacteria bacterium]|jgi:anaerobic selenocysteine-containing dehydrogenase|nr:molybdopterin-dependent oxidoreductase [Acidobacteriota bacterium]